MKNKFLIFAPLLAFNLNGQAVSALDVPPTVKSVSYRAVMEIPIKGQGGWDALTVDSDSHRLFVSHSDRVIVIDTQANKVIKEIQDTPGVHGIAVAPDLEKAFSSNGKENKVSVIDLKTLTTKNKIAVGEKPDAIVYNSKTREVYVFNGDGHSCSVISAVTEKVVATIELPGQPEFAVVSPAEHRVFVNIENKNSVAALDTLSHKIINVWKLDGCESPSGIALDAQNHRLMSVCENEKIVLVDTVTGHTMAAATTGKGTDGLEFDEDRKLAFSSNGKSATVTILHEDGAKTLAVVQNLQTKLGTRTIALDSKTHIIYLPTADLGPIERNGRPKIIDGTQRVLVYSDLSSPVKATTQK
jgi:YVTN family beta-propeller protein